MKRDASLATNGARVLLLAAIVAMSSGVLAAEPDALAATGSKQARNEAIRAIPWHSLSGDERQVVQHVVRNATLYRRMPTRVIDCDPAVFNFLGQHPDVVTELWKLMGVCNLDLERIGPETFRATDAVGTSGTMRFLASTWQEDAHNCALVYAEGTYHTAPFPRDVTARSVLLLRSGSTVETNGRPYITARLDSFILVDRLGVELVTKTLQPLLVKTADHNFVETMKFVSTFSRTAEKNPAGMQRLAQKLQKIDEPTRSGMAEVCSAAAARYRMISRVRHDGNVRLAGRDASAR